MLPVDIFPPLYSNRRAHSRLGLWAIAAAAAFSFGYPSLAGDGGSSDVLIAERTSGATLTWRRDFKEGLEAAARDNKLVLIDVYTDWCGWCKRLDRDTYTNRSVIELLNSQFICVKLNAEDGRDGQAVAKKYDVHGFPCTIVLEASGKLRGLFYGYRNPDGYSQEVAKILAAN